MNADGSAGVQADVSAGPKAPFLTEIGWTAIGRGAILLAAAALVCSALARRNRPRATQPSLAPSAS